MSGGELVDIVDEHDRIVSRVSRQEMRQRALRHRAVYVFVFNRAGQLFVHQRTASKDIYPACWDVTVSGVLRSAETYEGAAARELEEELGVASPELRRLFPLRYETEQNRVLGVAFSCMHDGPFILQASEIQSGNWEDLDEIIERAQVEAFCPDSLEAFRLYLSKLAAVQTR